LATERIYWKEKKFLKEEFLKNAQLFTFFPWTHFERELLRSSFSIIVRNSYRRGRISTVDFLVLNN
jgi:hypothetical protein